MAGGQGACILGMLALLTSFRRVALAHDADFLARRAAGLMGFVITLFVCAIGMRFLAEGSRSSAVLALTIRIGALIMAIIVLVKLLGLVHAVADILDQPESAEA